MKKKIFVTESLEEFIKRGPMNEGIDEVHSDEDEFDVPEREPTAKELKNVGDVKDEASDYAIQRRFMRTIDNELSIPEVDRGVIMFTQKSTGEVFKGIPLAKMNGGQSILFKAMGKGMKKVNINDIDPI